MAPGKRINPSIRIALMTIGGVAAAYGGYHLFAGNAVDGTVFQPVKPSAVNLVSVAPGMGYKVIIANQVAQLAQVSTEFGDTSNRGDESQEDSSASNKRRIPIKEMLDSLAGDEKALSAVIMRMNDLDKEDSLPSVKVIWKAADIKKALDGDSVLVAKLEKDLNVKLDGTPQPYVSVNSLENAIVLELPVPVKVNVEGQVKTLVGTIQLAFVPSLSASVMARYGKEAAVTLDKIKTYYSQEAQKMLDDPEKKQDIRADLARRISPGFVTDYAIEPERLLSNTKVLVNGGMITQASYSTRSDDAKAKYYDLRLDVSDEARKRLWQFSRKNRGFQLLFTVNGIAIAAPRIREELSQSDVTIKNLQDEDLVKDAISVIQGKN
ncbi:MAG: hypothetical protein K8R88_12440 [Armatimonadetes bacterium]|nr:hypothetical protein [Armatimonadota bacterium]